MDGTRLCCLYIPDFRLQVHLRDEPALAEMPWVLVRARGGERSARLAVEELSPAAQTGGVRRGMLLSQAEVACPGLVVRELDVGRCAAVADEVLSLLWALCPAVEPWRSGGWYIGMQGMKWLFADEATLMGAVLDGVKQLGLKGFVASAAGRFTSWVGAMAQSQALIEVGPLSIPTGGERAFLAPLPLSVLPEVGDLPERLAMLAIYKVGGLARLAVTSVERRYGAEGVRLHRLARGEDELHLTPAQPPTTWWTHLLLDEPVHLAEGLIFLIGPLVERLFGGLSREGRACGGMKIGLGLEGRQQREIELRLAAPTEQVRTLLELLRLQLARLDLPAGVVEITATVTHATDPAHMQQDLFERKASPSGIGVTLARLEDALGAGCLKQAHLRDGYLPERSFVLEPPGAALTSQPRGARGRGGERPAAVPEGGGALVGSLRWVSPGAPLKVKEEGERPTQVVYQGQGHPIVAAAGPFRYSGAWWEEVAYRRDYFRLRLANQTELLVWRAADGGGYVLAGVYD